MFQKISTSYALVKASFLYIQRDWELLVYSLLSFISSLAILVTFAGVGFFFFWENPSTMSMANIYTEEVNNILVYTGIFLYYFIFSFITFFFNTAIITSVQRRINGEENNFWDGLRDAMSHLKAILVWSTINALVSTLLKILQNYFGEDSFIGKIIVGMVWWIWNVLTFFSFPLMIINGLKAKEAIKESWDLFKETWWERAILHVGVWLFFFFLFLLILIISIAIFFMGFIFTGIIFLVFATIFLILVSSTCDTIIRTILLYYARTGEIPYWLINIQTINDIAGEKR